MLGFHMVRLNYDNVELYRQEILTVLKLDVCRKFCFQFSLSVCKVFRDYHYVNTPLQYTPIFRTIIFNFDNTKIYLKPYIWFFI